MTENFPVIVRNELKIDSLISTLPGVLGSAPELIGPVSAC